jgi:hypothetical protein
MIGAVFAGLAATQTSLAASAAGLPASMGADELAAKAAQWIAANERLAAMHLSWQDFESLLFEKAQRMRVSCDKAYRNNWPEAQAMRSLDKDIEETRRRLDAAAGEIRCQPATTIAGAIAKIELGLKVQGPFDWQDHALELLEDGVAELRGLLS